MKEKNKEFGLEIVFKYKKMKAQSTKKIMIKYPLNDGIIEVDHYFNETIPFVTADKGATYADNHCQFFLKKLTKNGDIDVIGTKYNHNMMPHVK